MIASNDGHILTFVLNAVETLIQLRACFQPNRNLILSVTPLSAIADSQGRRIRIREVSKGVQDPSNTRLQLTK
jgi:hypothetical protein